MARASRPSFLFHQIRAGRPCHSASLPGASPHRDSSSHGGRLITIHRPESRRPILQVLNSGNFSENARSASAIFFSNLHARLPVGGS